MYSIGVQALREELNRTGKVMPLSKLEKYTPDVLIGVVKLWLIQLPISVCR
jgi:hypothetical protein